MIYINTISTLFKIVTQDFPRTSFDFIFLTGRGMAVSVLYIQMKTKNILPLKILWNETILTIIILTILTGKKCVLFNSVQEWFLLLTFLICLHNQLSSNIHSITRIKSTDAWKMWFIKQTVKMNGCSFQPVLRQNLGWSSP